MAWTSPGTHVEVEALQDLVERGGTLLGGGSGVQTVDLEQHVVGFRAVGLDEPFSLACVSLVMTPFYVSRRY